MRPGMAEAQHAGPAQLPERAQRQQLGRRLRSVLRAGGWGVEGAAATRGGRSGAAMLLQELDTLCASGAVAAWRSVVQRIWQDEAVRLDCDRDPGLRTLLRRHATRDYDHALTTLLASRMRRHHVHGWCGAVAGRLWIADLCWDELPYHLELPDQGAGAATPAQLRSEWLAARGAHQRGVLHHPRLLGGLPASGITWPAAADLQPLRQALAVIATPGPFLILAQAELLPWSEPTVNDPAAATALRQARTQHGAWDAYSWREPLLALRQEDAHGAPRAALHAVLVRLLQEAGARGEMRAGLCHAPLGPARAHPPGGGWTTLPLLTRTDHLLVPADQVSRLPCALGWLPSRYQPCAGPCDWTWAELGRCGWHALLDPGPWRLVPAPAPGAGVAPGPWLALPTGSAPA